MRSGTELTVAVTNLINAFAAFFCLCFFYKKGLDIKRYRLWSAAYLLLMLNSFTGFILHGFYLSEQANIIVWSILYLLLGVMLESYVIAARHDILDDPGNVGSVLILIGFLVSVAIAVINVIDYHYSFPLFSLYGVLNVIYIIVLLLKKIRTDKVYLWYLAGIVSFIVGSLIQAFAGLRFTLIFDFNRDSIYHLFILAFLTFQFIGIRKTS